MNFQAKLPKGSIFRMWASRVRAGCPRSQVRSSHRKKARSGVFLTPDQAPGRAAARKKKTPARDAGTCLGIQEAEGHASPSGCDPRRSHPSSALTSSSIRNLQARPLGTRASCPLFFPHAAHPSSAPTSSSIRNLQVPRLIRREERAATRPARGYAPLNAGHLFSGAWICATPALLPPRRPPIVHAYFQFNQKPSGPALNPARGTRRYAPGARNAPLNAGILPALLPPRRPPIVRAYFQFRQKTSGPALTSSSIRKLQTRRA